ncbi:hypothetical protein [Bdellovibrio sp. NC01]|uniref:hypothetical protein n=1 Tax=Bdellovibrio sp. NC01 TaxID=2220073 RepID=UPI00143D66B3|nr:hypothetical protein [Bdellovibrio sp. NC01]
MQHKNERIYKTLETKKASQLEGKISGRKPKESVRKNEERPEALKNKKGRA